MWDSSHTHTHHTIKQIGASQLYSRSASLIPSLIGSSSLTYPKKIVNKFVTDVTFMFWIECSPVPLVSISGVDCFYVETSDGVIVLSFVFVNIPGTETTLFLDGKKGWPLKLGPNCFKSLNRHPSLFIQIHNLCHREWDTHTSSIVW